MKVYKVTPRGYCKGVVNAIDIAKKSVEKYPQPIYILGMIVHNQFIVDALTNLGITTIDYKGKTRLELLDHIDEGTVIITAHGCGDDVIAKATQKGLTVINATCKDVIKTHVVIQDSINSGKEVLYIGKLGHPESEGALSIDPNKVHLIEKQSDLDKYINTNIEYVITNQTTMSLWDVYNLTEHAKNKIPKLEVVDEICTATSIRQQAISKVPEQVDLIYVVGDTHSNNTNRLASIAADNSKATIKLVESVAEINTNDLDQASYVAITSGASTPTYITNLLIEYLEQYDKNDSSTKVKPQIDYNKILK